MEYDKFVVNRDLKILYLLYIKFNTIRKEDINVKYLIESLRTDSTYFTDICEDYISYGGYETHLIEHIVKKYNKTIRNVRYECYNLYNNIVEYEKLKDEYEKTNKCIHKNISSSMVPKINIKNNIREYSSKACILTSRKFDVQSIKGPMIVKPISKVLCKNVVGRYESNSPHNEYNDDYEKIMKEKCNELNANIKDNRLMFNTIVTYLDKYIENIRKCESMLKKFRYKNDELKNNYTNIVNEAYKMSEFITLYLHVTCRNENFKYRLYIHHAMLNSGYEDVNLSFLFSSVMNLFKDLNKERLKKIIEEYGKCLENEYVNDRLYIYDAYDYGKYCNDINFDREDITFYKEDINGMYVKYNIQNDNVIRKNITSSMLKDIDYVIDGDIV